MHQKCYDPMSEIRPERGSEDRITSFFRQKDEGRTSAWFQNTSRTEAENQSEGVSRLPTRLLDVGGNNGNKRRLIIANRDTTMYAALSHCWGKVRPLTTTSTNLNQHLISIPLSSMPEMFQDAVIASRELGIRYLWIDSLCIIQDSVEDWELECSKMGRIYQGSIVTICAPAAPNSSSGFLGRRACPEPAPQLWEYVNSKETRSKRATLSFFPDWGHGSQIIPASQTQLQRNEYQRFNTVAGFSKNTSSRHDYSSSICIECIGNVVPVFDSRTFHSPKHQHTRVSRASFRRRSILLACLSMPSMTDSRGAW